MSSQFYKEERIFDLHLKNTIGDFNLIKSIVLIAFKQDGIEFIKDGVILAFSTNEELFSKFNFKNISSIISLDFIIKDLPIFQLKQILFSWNGKIINGGGVVNNQGLKVGFWKELHINYSKNQKINFSGYYNQGKKNGIWQYEYFGQVIGGGFYDHTGRKQQQWVELFQNFARYNLSIFFKAKTLFLKLAFIKIVFGMDFGFINFRVIKLKKQTVYFLIPKFANLFGQCQSNIA